MAKWEKQRSLLMLQKISDKNRHRVEASTAFTNLKFVWTVLKCLAVSNKESVLTSWLSLPMLLAL